MVQKETIEHLISRCTDEASPVLEEYMLIPANVFFRQFVTKVEEKFGEKKADRYRTYIRLIKITFEREKPWESPYLVEIINMGFKKRDERLSEAILYSVFIYPMMVVCQSPTDT